VARGVAGLVRSGERLLARRRMGVGRWCLPCRRIERFVLLFHTCSSQEKKKSNTTRLISHPLTPSALGFLLPSMTPICCRRHPNGLHRSLSLCLIRLDPSDVPHPSRLARNLHSTSSFRVLPERRSFANG
jgi:hypothetical protein